jgi:hypothetical protein
VRSNPGLWQAFGGLDGAPNGHRLFDRRASKPQQRLGLFAPPLFRCTWESSAIRPT